MPHGGKYQMTETQAMVAKVPVLNGTTDAVCLMRFLDLTHIFQARSPYHGAIYAVVESIAKIVAAGGDYKKDSFYIPGIFPSYDRRS